MSWWQHHKHRRGYYYYYYYYYYYEVTNRDVYNYEQKFYSKKTATRVWNVSVFSISLLCTGLLSTDVDIRIQMNVSRASNVIILDIRRKKACLRGTSLLSALLPFLNKLFNGSLRRNFMSLPTARISGSVFWQNSQMCGIWSSRIQVI